VCLYASYGITVDTTSNYAYVDVAYGIKKIQLYGQYQITNLAGGDTSTLSWPGTDGTGSSATFPGLGLLAFDFNNQNIYGCYGPNIRKITLAGVTTTLVNSPGCSSITIDNTAQKIYSNSYNGIQAYSLIDASTTMITSTVFGGAAGVYFYPTNGNIYMTDNFNRANIYNDNTGIATTFTGYYNANTNTIADGIGSNVNYVYPRSFITDDYTPKVKDIFYFSDNGKSSAIAAIRKCNTLGLTTTLTNLPNIVAYAVAIDSVGKIYATDYNTNGGLTMIYSGCPTGFYTTSITTINCIPIPLG
jgi:hypothetical protein